MIQGGLLLPVLFKDGLCKCMLDRDRICLSTVLPKHMGFSGSEVVLQKTPSSD